VALLAIGAAGAAAAWSVSASIGDATRGAQASRNILEQEMERVRRLNWSRLGMTLSWVDLSRYDAHGNPLGPADGTAIRGRGYVSAIRVEPLTDAILTLEPREQIDTTGQARLRRVTVRVREVPEVAGAPPAAEAVTYLTAEGY